MEPFKLHIEDVKEDGNYRSQRSRIQSNTVPYSPYSVQQRRRFLGRKKCTAGGLSWWYWPNTCILT